MSMKTENNKQNLTGATGAGILRLQPNTQKLNNSSVYLLLKPNPETLDLMPSKTHLQHSNKP